MEFALSEDLLQIQKQAREFAETQIRPVAPHYDAIESFPWDVLRKAAGAGLYGLEFFERLRTDPGGLTAPIVSEELAWGCAGIALAILSTRLPYYALTMHGTASQIATWGPRMFGSPKDPRVAAFALSEPKAGSDSAAVATSAVRQGDEWVLQGKKVFVTNGGIADVHIVVATLDPGLRHRGQALFVVRSDNPGLSAGPKDRKLGVRASHTCSLGLNDVRIPIDQVLGGPRALEKRLKSGRNPQPEPGSQALRAVQAVRPLVAAQAIGLARAALEMAADHARRREQFGRPIIQQQAIAHPLAQAAVEIEAARLLVHKAAWASATGDPAAGFLCSAAKLKAATVASEVTSAALQALGGYGFMRESPAEKWVRDSKVYSLFEGTSEIQRSIIAKELF